MHPLESIREAFEANTVVYYILAASIVELIAAGIVCEEAGECKAHVAYAVAVGAVSTFFTFVHAIMASFKPMLADKISPYLSTFLLLWWIPGAGIPTFKAPFVGTGNGFFACWVGFLASMVFFQRTGLALFAGSRKLQQAPNAANNSSSVDHQQTLNQV